MPRILHKLRINEVSHVDRGAGEGVKVVLMKRDDTGSGPQIFARHKGDVSKMTDDEMFQSWWKELSAAERARYRRQQADIDAQLAEEERISRAGTTTRAEVAPDHPTPQPKKARDDNASLNSIIKQYGVCAVAKLVVDTSDAHGLGEAELMQAAGHYAASKGMSLGKLLNSDSGEGVMLAKAAAICRSAEHARQAQQNLGDARLRARAAKIG
jgi:hypothetical protein